ncbi:unnamed protein product [Arctia plantaginis]|uniref:DUF4455 domain-containing protein n=2 Tax=Arctia plantaginis TaxID=874455 RepID=A0A8S0Z083_ARCPL|nr:unnamed protein product [Arctia plantaginis]
MEISLSSSISSGKACACNKVVKNVQRVAKAGCSDDNDAVAALPDDWVPRHSGPILKNYLKQREQDHQSVSDDILKCTAVVNRAIDEKIRKLSENLLANIFQNQLDMDCVIEKCDKKKELLGKKDFDEAMKLINELKLKRIDEILSFKKEANALEKERGDGLKIVLREKFQHLISVGHLTPKELLHNFDERIYEINQQLLSNTRAFIDLEAQLRAQLDASIVDMRSNLNQLALGVGLMYRKRESVTTVRVYKDSKISHRRSLSADFCITGMVLGHSLLKDVKELDACIARVVQAYRTAVYKIYTAFSVKMDDLENDLCGFQVINDLNHIHLCEISDFQKLIEVPLRRLSVITNTTANSKTLFEITGADVITMQKSLYSLGERLQNTYLILNHAGHLWDSHILRSAHAQKLTMCAVEDLITSHDAIELANEIQLSIAMEQLRCAPDAEKLQQIYDPIVLLLEKTAEIYVQHSESELGRLEEYMNFPAYLSNTLLSEFDLFLEKYSRSSGVPNNVTSPRKVSTPPTRNSSQLYLPLPRAILQTELQELALNNWKNGFLESFQSNIVSVPEQLRQQAQLWVDERSTSLHMRYSFKMVSHSVRLERVKAARDARLAELRHHDARLESHLHAIYNLIDRLPVEVSEFGAIDSPIFYPYVSMLDRITNSINEVLDQDPPNLEEKKLKMSSYALRLPKHRELFEESLDKVITDYKLLLEHGFQEARVSNVRFMAQIKMFSEGGKYATQEAIKTSAALTKASETLEVCSNKTLEALHQRRSQLLAQADSLLLPVMRIVADVAKGSTKGNKQLEKSKSMTKKK